MSVENTVGNSNAPEFRFRANMSFYHPIHPSSQGGHSAKGIHHPVQG